MQEYISSPGCRWTPHRWHAGVLAVIFSPSGRCFRRCTFGSIRLIASIEWPAGTEGFSSDPQSVWTRGLCDCLLESAESSQFGIYTPQRSTTAWISVTWRSPAWQISPVVIECGKPRSFPTRTRVILPIVGDVALWLELIRVSLSDLLLPLSGAAPIVDNIDDRPE